MDVPDRFWTSFQAITSTKLNMLRIIREQVKPDLEKIMESLEAMHRRLDELEKKFGGSA